MSMKNKGLGRGLDALFQERDAVDQIDNGQIEPIQGARRTILIDHIKPGSSQPRRFFDDMALDQLADSIKEHGLLQPLLVRQNGSNAYEIIAGERRWRAAQKAELHDLPVIVLDISEREAVEVALVENLQREDLNPVEEAQGYKRLQDEFDHTQEELGQAVGKSRSHVANMMRLLTLPDMVLHHLETGALSMGHARTLIGVPNAGALALQIIDRNLSVREAEKLKSTPANDMQPAKQKPKKDNDIIALEQSLSQSLGLNVTINPDKKGQSGTIAIAYKTLDQCDTVINRLA